MDGWGVHTFRFVTEDGKSKLVKFRLRTLQGKASLLWEEAQIIAGKNADYHRQDLFDSIEAGEFPEYEVCISSPLNNHRAVVLTHPSSKCKLSKKKTSCALASMF